MSVNPKNTPWLKNSDREKELAEQKAYVQAMSKKAQECLADPKFVEYQLMYKQFEQETIDSIVYLKEDEPIKYAFKVRQLVDTLKAYRLLTSSVTEDAQRRIEQ